MRSGGALTETSTRGLPDGRVTPHYDPAMVRQFVVHPNDHEAMGWRGIRSLTSRLLRAARRDVRPPAARSRRAHAQPRPARRGGHRCAGCGHAPALNIPEHFALVERFFA